MWWKQVKHAIFEAGEELQTHTFNLVNSEIKSATNIDLVGCTFHVFVTCSIYLLKRIYLSSQWLVDCVLCTSYSM